MGMRSRRFVFLSVILVFALMAGMLVGCTTSDEDAEETDETTEETTEEATGEPIKIGAVLSLTGVYAGLGEPEKNVIDMEVERINAAGGVNGRPVEVIIEDDATEAEESVAATTRLIDQEEVVAIIGATGTGGTMAMREEVNAAGIPQVSIAGGTVITGDFDPLVFQTPWSNTLVVPFTYQALSDEGISKIALITDTGGFGADGLAVLEANADEYGMEIVASETFNPGDTDMTAQLTKIKGTDAEAVVMWSAGSEAATVAKNMMDLEMGIPLYGSHGNARKEFIEGAGDAAEGFRFAAGKILIPEAYGEGTPEYDVATDFIERYNEEYGEDPNTFAGHAYDALYIIVEALERLGDDFTMEELRDEIEATDGFIGIGGVFTYSADDHNGMTESDLVLYEVQDGAWILVE
jgi:branched-chain amino acid transport system substrate-binding protein